MQVDDYINEILKNPSVEEVTISKIKDTRSYNITINDNTVKCDNVAYGFYELYSILRYDPMPCTTYNYMRFIVTCHMSNNDNINCDFDMPTLNDMRSANVEFVYTPTFGVGDKLYNVKTYTYEKDETIVYNRFKWLYSITLGEHSIKVRGVLHDDI